MSLCHLCEEIPWESLPETPNDSRVFALGPPTSICEILTWPSDCRGFSHHQSLQALEHSVKDFQCGLCRLILKQARFCESELGGKFRINQDPSCTPQWKFWIVRRPNGDGFWVLMDVSYGVAISVALVATIGVCVRDGDPLAHIFRGRPVERDAGSLVGISRVRKWVTDCNEQHNCRPRETALPSRVIDVGDDVSNPHVKLRETSENERGTYISLSYCWGAGPHFTTTRATLQDRKQQIKLADLPKTQRDTVTLARELGIRYLWIDSICICQDDYKDWERESAKMISVYENSYLTVAASKSKHSAEGLFGHEVSREYFEFQCTVGDRRGSILAFNLPIREERLGIEYIGIPREPLSRRGWVLQERVLSPRTVLYTSQQICFECCRGFQGEDGLLFSRRFLSSYQKSKQGIKTSRRSGDRLDREHNIFSGFQSPSSAWYMLLNLYGPRKLTHASDKLPAISGLAKVYAEQFNDEYVAGLWRSSLIKDLMWDGTGSRRVREYRAPSWSWASVDCIPWNSSSRKNVEIPEVLDVQVTLKGANPYGEVTGGSIRLRAPMVPLHLATQNWEPVVELETPYLNHPTILAEHGKADAFLDFDMASPAGGPEARELVRSIEGVEIFALILLGDDSFPANPSYEGLIVRKTESGEDHRRLGTVRLNEEILGRRIEEQARDEFPIITLI